MTALCQYCYTPSELIRVNTSSDNLNYSILAITRRRPEPLSLSAFLLLLLFPSEGMQKAYCPVPDLSLFVQVFDRRGRISQMQIEPFIPSRNHIFQDVDFTMSTVQYSAIQYNGSGTEFNSDSDRDRYSEREVSALQSHALSSCDFACNRNYKCKRR